MFAAIFHPRNFYSCNNRGGIYKKYDIQKEDLVYSAPITRMEKSDRFWYVSINDDTYLAIDF